MSKHLVNTTIELLGKVYPIQCPEDEVESLLESASFLNDRMQQLQDSGKVVGIDRVAIITALNLAFDFLKLEKQHNMHNNKVNQRIVQLQAKIDEAMQRGLQQELLYAHE
jgi:cell division protein ZapA